MRVCVLLLIMVTTNGCCWWRSHHVSDEDLAAYNEQVEEELTRLREQNEALLIENNELRARLAEAERSDD